MNFILDQLKIKIDQITGKPGEGKILVLTPAKKYAEGIIDRPDVFVDFAKGKNEDDGKPSINTSLTDFMEKSIEDVRKIKPTDIEINGDVLRTNKQIIVSTRMIRGADLKDNLCRAVVMTKWPMGDISAGYNQALKLRFGDKMFWSIMRDKAERDAIQYVSRGLRHDWDWTFFSTADEDAFNRVYMLFTYD
jgi:Rad3-related DNA helicase